MGSSSGSGSGSRDSGEGVDTPPPTARPRARGVGLTRDAAAVRHVQTLVVTAVVTVLLTRLSLSETGYPKVATGHLHIAHALWGGLLMLLALCVQLTLLGERVRLLTAAVGGVGFGLFIDEVGKLVNRNSGYLYRPAVAIIYVTFVVLLAAAQLLLPVERMGPDDRLANAASIAAGGLHYGLTPARRAQAVRLIRHDAGGPQYEAVMRLLDVCPDRVSRLDGLLQRIGAPAARVRDAIAARSLIWAVVVVALGIQSLAGVAVLERYTFTHIVPEYKAVSTVVPALSVVLSLGLTAVGVLLLHGHRLAAYRLFSASLLVSILVTQVFLFAEYQFFALYGLAVNLLAYWIVGVKTRRLRAAAASAAVTEWRAGGVRGTPHLG